MCASVKGTPLSVHDHSVRIPELKLPGKRLGRHVHHDPRSLNYLYAAPRRTVVSTVWMRNTPILDQGSLGSCTGNAMDGALATGPVYTALPASHPALDETEAVALYSLATKLDSFQGQYPPDDTGSDGLSVAKAAKQLGFISAYQHCLDLDTMLQALMAGPVIVGINWYSSFDTPSSAGIVKITKTAYVRGGHEILCREVDTVNQLLWFDNSWGLTYGLNGRFGMSYAAMTRLFAEDGDCVVPLPLVVAPPPPPPPGPVAHTPIIYTADGSLSLVEVSAVKGSPVSTILRTTLQQFTAFSSGMSAYLQAGDLSQPLPAGERLCLAWPLHQIV
jgi:hypothetical protein